MDNPEKAQLDLAAALPTNPARPELPADAPKSDDSATDMLKAIGDAVKAENQKTVETNEEEIQKILQQIQTETSSDTPPPAQVQDVSEEQLLQKYGIKEKSLAEFVDKHNKLAGDYQSKLNITSFALNDPELSQMILRKMMEKQGLKQPDATKTAELPAHLKNLPASELQAVEDTIKFVLEKEGYVRKAELEQDAMQSRLRAAEQFQDKFFESDAIKQQLKSLNMNREQMDTKIREIGIQLGLPPNTVLDEKIVPRLYNLALIEANGGVGSIVSGAQQAAKDELTQKRLVSQSFTGGDRRVVPNKEFTLEDFNKLSTKDQALVLGRLMNLSQGG